MAVSQSSNNQVKCEEQAVAVQFDPKGSRFSGFASGEVAVGCLALFGLALLVIVSNWGKDMAFSNGFMIAILVCLFIFLMVNSLAKKPKLSVTHKVLNFDGIGEKTVAALLGMWMTHTAPPPQLPEPDAKFDSSQKKVLPFAPGEKEKVLEDQKRIEENVKTGIATLSSSVAAESAGMETGNTGDR